MIKTSSILRAWPIIALLVWAGLLSDARAERYLTVEQAQKLCFPSADEFEIRTLVIGAKEASIVEQKTGLRPRPLRHRMWLARRNEQLLGVLIVDQVMGKHELIDYAVAISPAGVVQHVEVLEYRESHGGAIRGSKWRRQFAGKSAESPLELNEDIYNISGATMSCRSITQGVKRVLAVYELFGRPRLLAAGELPHGHQESRHRP